GSGNLGATGAVARRDIAGAAMRATGFEFTGHKTTGVSASWCDATRSGVDGAGQAAGPAVEVIPAQKCRGAVARLIVFGSGQVEFAEHGACVIGLGHQLGDGNFPGVNL